MQTFSTIGQPFMGEKSHGGKKKERIMLSIVATTFCMQRLKTMHFARTNLVN